MAHALYAEYSANVWTLQLDDGTRLDKDKFFEYREL